MRANFMMPVGCACAIDRLARHLAVAVIALGGEVNYLTPDEGEKADKINFIVLDRIWNLWKMRILPTLAK